MKQLARSVFCMIVISLIYKTTSAQITLVDKQVSSYVILIPEYPTRLEEKTAQVLQDYLARVSSCTLKIIQESKDGQFTKKIKKGKVISVGNTLFAEKDPLDLPSEGFSITQVDDMLLFQGTGKGLLYAAYSFVEDVLGCRKWYADEPAVCFPQPKVVVPQDYARQEAPAFQYREVYFPVEGDEEYVNWHKIHLLDDLWGLWGHSFNFLVSPTTYFNTHPEYFSFFNGSRQPNQLCLSNPAVLEISVESIAKAIDKDPDATFWSISPNDDPVYCECINCKKIDDLEGGPQGSLIHFVNQIAARFPEHHFTTLAYTYTARPTETIKPLKNVTIFLSNIDANRSLPIVREPSARSFRTQLEGWSKKADKVFIWDYYTQFTNYLAPFPNLHTFKENMQYYKTMGVKGVFAQGSGATYGEMAELKSYVLAKLLWNPALDVDSLESDFLRGYYGAASKAVKQYLEALQQNSQEESLNIYGNPIHHHEGYLSLKNMDAYSSMMDEAERAVEGNQQIEQRIERLRLSQEYVFLQQARFYGIEPHGIFHEEGKGHWTVNDRIEERVANFTANAIANQVTELSEGGLDPKGYQLEWDRIFASGAKTNLALNAMIMDPKSSFDPSFPAKGWRTLVDGNPGYDDFSYNWLCFYSNNMEFSLDLKKAMPVGKVSMNFLVDPRHWIFAPKLVRIEVSEDGIHYEEIGEKTFSSEKESLQIERAHVTFKNTLPAIRFIKVLARPLDALPMFRYHKTKKPMMACDEIWVE